MSRLILLMSAIIGAVLVLAVLGTRVALTRRAARAAKSAEAAAEIGGWENEGGSIAVAGSGEATVAATPRAGSQAGERDLIIQPKAA
jgi:hypothetical protein